LPVAEDVHRDEQEKKGKWKEASNSPNFNLEKKVCLAFRRRKGKKERGKG